MQSLTSSTSNRAAEEPTTTTLTHLQVLRLWAARYIKPSSNDDILFSLSLCISLSLSVGHCLFLSRSLPLPLHPSIHLSLSLSSSVPHSLSLSLRPFSEVPMTLLHVNPGRVNQCPPTVVPRRLSPEASYPKAPCNQLQEPNSNLQTPPKPKNKPLNQVRLSKAPK